MESLTVLSFIKVQNDAVLANQQLHHGSIHSIKDFKDYKKLGPDFAQIWLKHIQFVWDRQKIAQKFRDKYFRQIFVKKM